MLDLVSPLDRLLVVAALETIEAKLLLLQLLILVEAVAVPMGQGEYRERVALEL